MSGIVETIEWECDTVRLVKLDGLAQHANFPHGLNKRSGKFYKIRDRKIEHIIIHHAAGARKEGIKQPVDLAKWVIRDPIYRRDEAGNIIYRTTKNGRKKPRTKGGGRGWPGAPYTFQVPAIPAIVDGKIVVYRLWDDDWRTWHTGKAYNTHGVGVCVGGWYASRHGASTLAQDKPDATAIEGLERLVLDYLLPRYGLDPEDDEALMGHFDAGKAMCPGDWLETWVRQNRGEFVDAPRPDASGGLDARPLSTWKQRQEVLVSLGYDVGEHGIDGVFGWDTRSAIRSFQEDHGLVDDGIWGPMTETKIRAILKAQATPV